MTDLERELLTMLGRVCRDGMHQIMREHIASLMDGVESEAIERNSLPKVPGFEMIGTSPHPILGMAVINDHLIVATTHGVFERSPDGTIRELRLEPKRS
jgi:hypothetical protein